MGDEPVRVIAYAGGRGEERPRAFFLGEKMVEVETVVRAWIEEEGEGRERKRFFRVKGDDGAGHLLYYDERLRAWFLSPGDSPTP
jgi:hypothetical protein